MKSFAAFLFALILPISVLFFPGCTPEEEVDFTVLEATIGDAQHLYDTTEEGTFPGQFPSDARNALNAAISAAEQVRNKAGVTQPEVDAAVLELQSAIAAYQASVVGQIQADYLVAYYPFSGNADDLSGNNLHGTPMAGHIDFGAGDPPSLTTDRYGNDGQAYFFEKGGNIEVPYDPSLNPESITLSFWCKPNAPDRFKTVLMALNRNNGYQLQLFSSQKLYATFKCVYNQQFVYNDDDSGEGIVPWNAWTHVAVAYADGSMRFYVNGVLVNALNDKNGTLVPVDQIAFTIGSDLPTGTYEDAPGAFYVGYGGYFTGAIDEVRIYNTMLSNSDIEAIYQMERP